MVFNTPIFFAIIGTYLAKTTPAKICVAAEIDMKISLPTNSFILTAIKTITIPKGSEERKIEE